MATESMTVLSTPATVAVDSASVYIVSNVSGGEMRYRWQATGDAAPDPESAFGPSVQTGDSFAAVGRNGEVLWLWMTKDGASGEAVVDRIP